MFDEELRSFARTRRPNSSRLFGAYASNLFVVSKARLDQRSAAFWRLVMDVLGFRVQEFNAAMACARTYKYSEFGTLKSY
jgi:hypothetical protein